jgi:hypothetical protein
LLSKSPPFLSAHAAAITVGTAATLLYLTAAPATAQIIGTAGDAQVIAPPASVVPDQLESPTAIQVFAERSGVILPVDLTVNFTEPGLYDEISDLTGGTIAAGTIVDTYFLHSDPIGVTPTQYAGSVTFATDVLGVIVLTGRLELTDAPLGSPTTIYPASGTVPFRDMELQATEFVQLSPDRRTLRFVAGTAEFTDQVRVITASAAPESGTLPLLALGVGAGGILAARRKQQRR